MRNLEDRAKEAADLLKKEHDALNRGDIQLMYQYHKQYIALYQKKPEPEKEKE